jgi:hypothetical protein
VLLLVVVHSVVCTLQKQGFRAGVGATRQLAVSAPLVLISRQHKSL